MFVIFYWNTLKSHTANMATYVDIRQPVTILVTVFSNPKNLTNVIYLTNYVYKTNAMYAS